MSASKKTVKTVARKLLSKAQRSAISKRAAFAAHRTMQSKKYQSIKKSSRTDAAKRKAINAMLAAR